MISASTLNTLIYDQTKCVGCGMCVQVCPHGVFAMDGRLAILTNGDACMECGACQLNCPTDAIGVESGVGCAAAMMRAAILRRSEPACG
jgi:NAD-dependent dihydropyrimidine dehydrogenase PreA subunit